MAEGRLGGRGPAPASSPGLSPQDHEPSTVLSDLLLRGAERCLALQKELKSAARPPAPPPPWAGPPPSRALGTLPKLDTHPPCCGSRGSGAKFPCAGMRRGWGRSYKGQRAPREDPSSERPSPRTQTLPPLLPGSLKAGRCCQPAQSWGEINQHPQGPWLAQLCRQPRREGG